MDESATHLTPDLQSSLICDDVRQERNGKFILIGLFDMIGNVAEMVSEEGKAKGGGWNSFISECYADQSQKYEGWGHPEVGFRLFMEIIEP